MIKDIRNIFRIKNLNDSAIKDKRNLFRQKNKIKQFKKG